MSPSRASSRLPSIALRFTMSTRMSEGETARADRSDVVADEKGHGVKVLLTDVEGANIGAAIAAVRRQVYEPYPELVVVGADPDEVPEGVEAVSDLEEAIAGAGSEFEYLWILHADARPRPDALRALVTELSRNEAALAGSKLLVAGTENELESVGSATDVFGEPYSGLEPGEIDLQQYDVVREVAFVPSASMLVRRDLAQGLRGLDRLLPPVAAGLDFSQRARLAGGRVISVPSSEVYHQGRCATSAGDWRERAGGLRSMLTAYSPLTLTWVVPYDFVVSVADSIANLLLLRWRPAVSYARSWLWNLLHLPSTIKQRRRFRSVRSAGDEELFRFQARGSIRLRETGSELTGRILSVFDEDQALARGTQRLRSSPGIWGALAAVILVFFGVRSIIFTGMPNSGFTFALEPHLIAIERWAGGWNGSGLGSAAPVHPSVGLSGAVSWLLFGGEGAARALATVVAGLSAVIGLGRLSGRMGLRGPGRYLAGLVLLAGPGTAVLTGAGSWTGLMAAGVLPWAVRASLAQPGAGKPTAMGWVLLTAIPLAALSPALVVVPLLITFLWRVLGGSVPSLLLALLPLVGVVVALPFLVADPGWLVDPSRSLELMPHGLWFALVVTGAVSLWAVEDPARRVGITGALAAVTGMSLARAVPMGPGLEEAVLVMASMGAALLVAGAADVASRDVRKLVAVIAAAGIVIVSFGSAGNGRLGLPAGDLNSRISFAATLAGEAGPGRVLLASTERLEIPGEARPGPGFWYRLVDGAGMTHSELWLPPVSDGELSLRSALEGVASGSLRPGKMLSEYSIRWVVLLGQPFVLDEALDAQLDLVPTPLDSSARVFENPDAVPVAYTDSGPWEVAGTGFSGDPTEGRLHTTVSYHPDWSPDAERESWATSLSAREGVASFRAQPFGFWASITSALLVVGGLVLVGVGRRSR